MERAIRFMAPVIPQTTEQLFGAIDNLLQQGTTKIRLLISTPGGSVFHGLSIYNFLKGLPIEVDTYNFGSVDSIGVVIFCAGGNRFTVPHSRFLIHSVKFNINQPVSMDEKQLEEHLKSLQIDERNIAKVIADTANKKTEDLLKDMINRTTLNPDQAKDYGLVHEVKHELIAPNMQITTIGEPIQGHPNSQRQFIVPSMKAVSEPNVKSYTENVSTLITS